MSKSVFEQLCDLYGMDPNNLEIGGILVQRDGSAIELMGVPEVGDVFAVDTEPVTIN